MVITWYGHSCFKIQSGELVLAIDPFAKDIGLTPPRFRADAVLITHGHSDHSNAGAIAGEPFLISGPGEYELRGIIVRGIETFHDAKSGRTRGKNTAYVITLEDIRLLHLGDFGEAEMRDETLEEIGEVDVCMIPVGGVYTIDASAAARIVKQVEPRLVIPMHYRNPGLKFELEPVEKFLKEMGAGGTPAEDKLSLKKKDFTEGERIAVRVLKPANA